MYGSLSETGRGEPIRIRLRGAAPKRCNLTGSCSTAASLMESKRKATVWLLLEGADARVHVCACLGLFSFCVCACVCVSVLVFVCDLTGRDGTSGLYSARNKPGSGPELQCWNLFLSSFFISTTVVTVEPDAHMQAFTKNTRSTIAKICVNGARR